MVRFLTAPNPVRKATIKVFDPNPVRLETAPTGLGYIAGVENLSEKPKTK